MNNPNQIEEAERNYMNVLDDIYIHRTHGDKHVPSWLYSDLEMWKKEIIELDPDAQRPLTQDIILGVM